MIQNTTKIISIKELTKITAKTLFTNIETNIYDHLSDSTLEDNEKNILEKNILENLIEMLIEKKLFL